MTKLEALNIVKELIAKERKNADLGRKIDLDETADIVEIAFSCLSNDFDNWNE